MSAILDKATGIPITSMSNGEEEDANNPYSVAAQAASLPQLLVISQAPETALWLAEKAAGEGMAVHVTKNPLAALADAIDGKFYHACIMETDFPIMSGIEALPRWVRGRTFLRRQNRAARVYPLLHGPHQSI